MDLTPLSFCCVAGHVHVIAGRVVFKLAKRGERGKKGEKRVFRES